MRVRALYAGKTFSISKMEVIKYAIISEKDRKDIDIAVLSWEPPEGIIKFGNPEKKWIEYPPWEVCDRIFIISGILWRAPGTGIISLDDVKVDKDIPAKVIAETLMKKGEEMKKIFEEKGAIYGNENVVDINGVKFKIIRPYGATSSDEVEAALIDIYTTIVTDARKYTFVAAPVFIELTWNNNTGWYVVTLARVARFIRDHPEVLAQVGIIDPEGFKTPYFIATDMMPLDLGDLQMQRASAIYLNTVITRKATMYGKSGGIGGAEEELPI